MSQRKKKRSLKYIMTVYLKALYIIHHKAIHNLGCNALYIVIIVNKAKKYYICRFLTTSKIHVCHVFALYF